MRVTNRASTRNYLRHMNNALSNQAKIQERVSSGNRFERISEDVSSGVQAMNAKTELYKTEKHLSNVSSINETLTAAEDAMDTINTLLADINTKILKGYQRPNQFQPEGAGTRNRRHERGNSPDGQFQLQRSIFVQREQ